MSNAFVTIKMCYMHNQWYDISYATLYIPFLRRLPEEGDLSLRHVGVFNFMYNL